MLSRLSWRWRQVFPNGARPTVPQECANVCGRLAVALQGGTVGEGLVAE